ARRAVRGRGQPPSQPPRPLGGRGRHGAREGPDDRPQGARPADRAVARRADRDSRRQDALVRVLGADVHRCRAPGLAPRGAVPGHTRLRRGWRTAHARAPPNGHRRPEVRVTITARFRHPRVTISSLRSWWGGGWWYRS